MTLNDGKPSPTSTSHPVYPETPTLISEVAVGAASRDAFLGARRVRPNLYDVQGSGRNHPRTSQQLSPVATEKNFRRHHNTPAHCLLKAGPSADPRGWKSSPRQQSESKPTQSAVRQSQHSRRPENRPPPLKSQTVSDQPCATNGREDSAGSLKPLRESVDRKTFGIESQKTTKKVSYTDCSFWEKVKEDVDIGTPLEYLPNNTALENKDKEKDWFTAHPTKNKKTEVRPRKQSDDPEELFYKKFDRSLIKFRPTTGGNDSHDILRDTLKSSPGHPISGKLSCSSKPLTEADRSLEKLASDLKARLMVDPPETVASSSTQTLSSQNLSYAAIAAAASLAVKAVHKPLTNPSNSDRIGSSAVPAVIIAKMGQSLSGPPGPRTPKKRQNKVKKSSQRPNKRLSDEHLKRLTSRFRQALAVSVESAPTRRRKEREKPKPKRLTKLKRGVLNDRLARRHAVVKTASLPYKSLEVSEEFPTVGEKEGSSTPLDNQPCRIETPDRPTSQTTDSGNVPKTDVLYADIGGQQLAKSPNPLSVTATRNVAPPRFPELETLIQQIIASLADFHDRAYKSNESNASKKKKARRIVCGFREVIKHLKLNRMRLVVIATDLEKGAYEIDDRPTLEDPEVDNTVSDDAIPSRTNAIAKVIQEIVCLANQRECPVILAFKRHYLKRLCHKSSPVSVVGVINVDGAEDKAKQLLEEWRLRVTQTTVTT
ncbi:Selenocysteine insertion sequence-binding protein 2-like [Sparganum proliferum]